KNKEVFVIGVLMPPLDTVCNYYCSLYTGMENAVNELSPFRTELILEAFDRTIDHDAFEKGKNLISKGIDALITTPVVPQDFIDLIPHLDNIPYVFIDTQIGLTQPFLSISQNPYKGGYCAGRMMQMLKGSGTFACIRMFQAAYNLRERVRGFTDFFKKDSNSTVLDMVCTDFTDAGLYKFMDTLFKEHQDIKGIFVPHAEVSLATYYLIDNGLKDKVTVIGYDLNERNKDGIQGGLIDCLIGQRPEQQGFDAVNKLYQSCMLHQQIPDHIEVPIDIYFKENIL
ncbi:MAG: substrate-binding domain-containing protein, partial [Treponemataceae bacterium]|nr:substrate-binding domain-containing protein [Treponemataceae bacterium]